MTNEEDFLKNLVAQGLTFKVRTGDIYAFSAFTMDNLLADMNELVIDKKQFKEIIERTSMHIGTHSCEIMEQMLIKELGLKKIVLTGTESEVLKRNESTNKN